MRASWVMVYLIGVQINLVFVDEVSHEFSDTLLLLHLLLVDLHMAFQEVCILLKLPQTVELQTNLAVIKHQWIRLEKVLDFVNTPRYPLLLDAVDVVQRLVDLASQLCLVQIVLLFGHFVVVYADMRIFVALFVQSFTQHGELPRDL